VAVPVNPYLEKSCSNPTEKSGFGGWVMRDAELEVGARDGMGVEGKVQTNADTHICSSAQYLTQLPVPVYLYPFH
jgi:hypothetical protein